MIDHIHIKELVSANFDGQTTPQEKKLVEEHLKECALCQEYSRQLHKLSATLNEWTNEDLSPDLEQKIQLGFKEAIMSKEKLPIQKRPLFKVGVGGGGALVAILILILSVHTYTERALQRRVHDAGQYLEAQTSDEATRLKSFRDGVALSGLSTSGQLRKATDKIGAQFSKANTRAVGETDLLKAEGLAANAKIQYAPYYLNTNYQVTGLTDMSRTRALGGMQASTYSAAFSLDGYSDSTGRMPRYWTTRETYQQKGDTEQYDRIYENEFLTVRENPLSTFSIDVDTASYSNMRRFLNNGQLPPEDSIRVEELVNYFTYDYPKPQGEHPFSITTRVSVCPWNKGHQLVQIGLQGKTLEENAIPPSNLVFLIDVSGSMNQANKLPLLKTAFKMLVNQLGDKERVAIVVYAGAAGVVLNSTPGSNKQAILWAIDKLGAGGSTAGGAGIKLAYKIARENFIQEGNNRVILATDGDFNVGASSNAEMIRLIEEERKAGTFLTVLGFGTGNYKDSRMEQIADKGNGNYYYIDTEREAKKVLVNELGSTLFTIAKDVKLQIEFNPTRIKAYRLIGYENRILAKEDFADDTKDAGELGAGHTVTALYEIVPVDSEEEFRDVDKLVYQRTQVVKSNDLLTVKLRYKDPDGTKSKLIKKVVTDDAVTQEPQGDFQFASAVAEFGLLLRNSKFKSNASYQSILTYATESKGKDRYGYRAEFIDLVEKAQSIDLRQDEQPGIIFKGQ